MNFFKKKNEDETLNNNIQLLQKMKKDVRDLRELYGYMTPYVLSKKVKEICVTVDKIVKEVSLHQEKIGQLNLFIDYYMPTTIKLVSQYLDIKENKLTGNENEQMIIMIEDTLPKINMAYKALLNQLFSDENKEMDVEIRLLLEELKRIGK